MGALAWALAIVVAGCGGGATAADAAGPDLAGDVETPGPDAIPDTGSQDNPLPAQDATGPDAEAATTPPDEPTWGEQICSPRTKFVYLITDQGRLLRFHPALRLMEEVGTANCGESVGTQSMAVDHLGNAWVLFNDGRLFKVSTANGTCLPTGFRLEDGNFRGSGMGFALNGTVGDEETMFLSWAPGQTPLASSKGAFGSLALPALALIKIGVPDWDGGEGGELTGDGAGNLWGFVPGASGWSYSTAAPVIVRIDKGTAAALETIALPQDRFVNVDAYAFASWGGNFYLFANGNGLSRSSVYRVARDGTFETWMGPGSWVIAGAGVSDCAPTVMPIVP